MLIPCRCSSFSFCTSLPLNKSRNLLRLEWAPVYHVKGWGKFKRHYGDFCTGADRMATIPHCGHARNRGALAQGRIPFVLEADLQGQEARRETRDVGGSSGIDFPD